MDTALKRLAGAVDQHGGHVTRFQGDGFKAAFGVPLAHENDPEQAVRAGYAAVVTEQCRKLDLNDHTLQLTQ
jgi:class 3 adenylate cyclase